MQQETSTKQLALLGVSLIWGTTFVLGKYSISYIPVFQYLSMRFFLASLVLLFFSWSILLKSTRKQIFISFTSGLLVFASYAFQTLGLQYTTASKNAFICGLYVVLVPFAAWLVYKKTITINAALGAVLAALGLAFLSLSRGDGLGINYGDWLAFLSAIFAAFQIIVIGRYAKEIHPFVLTFFQLTTVAAVAGLTSFSTGEITLSIPLGVWGTILFLSILATTLAFLIQCWAQQNTNNNVTAIIFSLEAVFGAFFAYLILHEPLTQKMIFGCLLLFCAMIVSQRESKKEGARA